MSHLNCVKNHAVVPVPEASASEELPHVAPKLAVPAIGSKVQLLGAKVEEEAPAARRLPDVR